MKTMWTFSITKGWYRSENSLAEVTSASEARAEAFEQMNTPTHDRRPDSPIRMAIFFQRVRKDRADYLACYTIANYKFWFYMPNTAAFIEALSRHQSILR
jgi:hypothetical protein